MMQFIIEKINLFIKKEYKNLLTGYYKDINALCNIDDNVTRMIFNNSADKRICSENIKKSIDNFLDFNCDDEEYVEAIDELKSYICKEFNIPPTEDELKEWLKEDSIRHSLIIDLYNHL